MADKSAQSVANALNALKEKTAFRSITSDNGTAFAYHQHISQLLKAPWYFADPNSPHQRGKNENQTGLIRQYLNRKTELNQYSLSDIDHIQNRINNRPRKKHNFIAPIKCFFNHAVALEG